jgi:hypothetical protein
MITEELKNFRLFHTDASTSLPLPENGKQRICYPLFLSHLLPGSVGFSKLFLFNLIFSPSPSSESLYRCLQYIHVGTTLVFQREGVSDVKAKSKMKNPIGKVRQRGKEIKKERKCEREREKENERERER